ncbi:GAF and ANTAR domain-containing protein [Kribbella sp. CA-247076]|uniref:GAF and ANTAR domain-containing protein n=1 Tax=Kribbella sp. CA-247076 TaxID=3239941 RepID=UPI003D94E74A
MTSHGPTQAPLPERAVRGLAAATAALVTDHDVIGSITNLLHNCADSVDATAAGILLTEPDTGRLEFLSATNHRAEHLELYQLQVDEGPGPDCIRSGRSVTVTGLDGIAARWPTLRDAFAAAGFDGVHAAPMTWHGRTLGAVNLFLAGRPLTDEQELVSQAFADVACLIVIHTRPTTPAAIAAQTRAALADRATIERAKGVVAYTENVTMDAAFDRLVDLARDRGEPLTTTAADVVARAAGS